MNNFGKILMPVALGKKTMRNRIMMAPMESRLNTQHGDTTPALIDYYSERAKGGAGAVVVENTYVDDKSSRSGFVSSGLYNDHMIAGKSLLAEAIKEHGAIAILQLSHGGPQANPQANDSPILVPSALENMDLGKAHIELTVEMIHELEEAFAQAARRAWQAGFDGVELHAAHGYLLSSFLSPHKNKRSDSYGGSAENKTKIIVEIIDRIRGLTPPGFIIGVRMNAFDGVDGGVTVNDACQTARILQDSVDYLSISAGIGEVAGRVMIPPLYIATPVNLAQIKKVAECIENTLVFGVAGFDEKSADSALEEGWLDGVVMGRALIADPELPKKLREGRVEDIRPCCRGNEGCFSRLLKASPMRCEVNPACGRESQFPMARAATSKKILVVGGGIAGLEAARLAKLLGHSVEIVERTNKLGGHLIEATVPEFKKHTGKLLAWLVNQIKMNGIKVHFNTEFTPEMIAKYNPDEIIIAIGSRYVVPAINGAEHSILPDDALINQANVGERVVIVGAGMVGSETALCFAMNGKKVTLVEMREIIAPEHDPGTRDVLNQMLIEYGATILLNSKVVEIGKDYIQYCDSVNNKNNIFADTIILATGLAADTEQTHKYEKLPNIHFIGDCVSAAKIYQATHDAWRVIFDL